MNLPKRRDFLRVRRPHAAAKHRPPELGLEDEDAIGTVVKSTGEKVTTERKMGDTISANVLRGRI